MAIRIPEDALPRLLQLARLDPLVMAKLKDKLRQQQPALTLSVLAGRIASAGIGLNETAALSLIGLLASLYSARTHHETHGSGLEAFIEQLLEQLREQATKSAIAGTPEQPAIDWNKFAADLKDLLSLDRQLGITSKALDVMTDHHRVFRSARILTDLRPVFTDVAQDPAAAVIIHNLKILYQEHNVVKEFFVALDSVDLSRLKEILDRASLKEGSVRSMIAKIGVESLDPQR